MEYMYSMLIPPRRNLGYPTPEDCSDFSSCNTSDQSSLGRQGMNVYDLWYDEVIKQLSI